MIKAFLFDYDGVMTAGANNDNLTARLANNLSIPHAQAADWIKSIWADFSTGKLSEAEVWDIFEKSYRQKISNQQRDIWFTWEELRPLDEMVNLVRSLRESGYAVGLLSNIFPVTAELIRSKGGYDGFDFLVLSCEAGARKPDIKIYESAMSNLSNIQANEVVFLDDTERCVNAGNAFGLHTIHVKDHDTAIQEVRSLIRSNRS